MLIFIIYYFLMMISPQILDKLKPDDHYIIKPTNRTNSRSNKKPLNETARTPN